MADEPDPDSEKQKKPKGLSFNLFGEDSPLLGETSRVRDRLRALSEIGQIRMPPVNPEIFIDTSTQRTANAAEDTAESMATLVEIMKESVALSEATRDGQERIGRFTRTTAIISLAIAGLSLFVALTTAVLSSLPRDASPLPTPTVTVTVPTLPTPTTPAPTPVPTPTSTP